MAKKFLAVTMVLVLAAGVAAFAQDDGATFTGSWDNDLTLAPSMNAPLDSVSSTLTLGYTMGGIEFESESTFDYSVSTFLWSGDGEATGELDADDDPVDSDGTYIGRYWGGFDTQKFTVAYSVGLLDISSTLAFNPSQYWQELDLVATENLAGNDSNGESYTEPWMTKGGKLVKGANPCATTKNACNKDVAKYSFIDVYNKKKVEKPLKYWNAEGSLTLGGVELTGVMQLELNSVCSQTEPVTLETTCDHDLWTSSAKTISKGGQFSYDYNDGDYSFGSAFIGSGETPGGISVTATNLMGLKKTWDPWEEGYGAPSDDVYAELDKTDPQTSREYIVVDNYDSAVCQTSSACTSCNDDYSTDYTGSIFELEGAALGCVEWGNTTVISGNSGFEYTEFDFTVASNNWPLSIDTWINFSEQTKSVTITPELDLGWSCFTVYSALAQVTEDNDAANNAFGLDLGAMKLEVDFNGLTFTSITALGDHTFADFDPTTDPFGKGPFTSRSDVYDAPYNCSMEKITVAYNPECPECNTLDFSSSVYFANNSDVGFMDFTALTGDVDFMVNEFLTLGGSTEWHAGSGLDSLGLEFDVSW